MAPTSRNFVISHVALELDGKVAGFVRQASGGGVHAEVVQMSSPSMPLKHIGAVKFEDLVLTVGPDLSRVFYDWVGTVATREYLRKNGAILRCDSSYRVQSRLEWSNGLLSAVNFPTLDVASKDQAALTVKISPEATRYVTGDGSQLKLIDSPKPWVASSFHLQIGDLKTTCSSVSRIETITMTNETTTHTIGNERHPVREPGRLSLSDLVVTIPESRAKPFQDWFEDFVIKGNNSSMQEKSGSLDFLTPQQSAAIFSLRFDHLGPYAITQPSSRAGAGSGMVVFKMYCEEMRFTAPGASS
jgi:hypothetical protein